MEVSVKKLILLLSLLFLNLATVAQAGELAHISTKSQIPSSSPTWDAIDLSIANLGSNIKSAAPYLIAGAAAAGATHIATSSLETLAHEYGHVFAGKMVGAIDHEITLTTQLSFLSPFTGNFRIFFTKDTIPAAGSYAIKAIDTAGPIAEVITGYSLSTMITATGHISPSDALKKPVTVYSDLSEVTKKFITEKHVSQPSLSKVFFTSLALFKSTSLLLSSMYGFTPLFEPYADGAKLWNFSLGYSYNTCALLATSPVIAAGLYGLYKGVRENMKQNTAVSEEETA